MFYIKELRESTNLSQIQFAKMFHIPVSTLRKWEQNESNPPDYVVRFLENALPRSNKSYKVYLGKKGQKFYLDEKNKRVSDDLGNWITFHHDIEGVMEKNIGIYIDELFEGFYKAVKDFDEALEYDSILKIEWR